MARRPRIENAGFHHIYNRGVEKRNIFIENKDKEKFLDIVCEVSTFYDFVIHGYALMDNHYHLLLENKRENLSHGMRQINATYAQYFNKKYERVGHLWQDRYKSWYIFDDEYLFTLFKYIEYNPIKANVAKEIGAYPYTFIHDMLQNKLKGCMQNSFILKWCDNINELLNSLNLELSDEEQDSIKTFQKEAIRYKSLSKKVQQKLKLKDYFSKKMSKDKRNEAIQKAIQDGFMQSEIAKHLGLTCSAVSKIVKKLKVEP